MQQINIIISLDWKAGIEYLDRLLSIHLQRQYSLQLELPQPDQYDEMPTVGDDGVLEDFDRALQLNDLQLQFIDTQSNEHLAVLHRLKDKEKLQAAVTGMG